MVINSCSINEKKILFVSVEEVALTVSAKPSVTLKALCPDGALPLADCLPGSGLTPASVICLLSPREGNTMTGVESAPGTDWEPTWWGAELGSAELSGGRLGMVMVCGFSVECSGMSCLAALVLGYIASSKTLKIAPVGEESDTQLQIELVRNLS